MKVKLLVTVVDREGIIEKLKQVNIKVIWYCLVKNIY